METMTCRVVDLSQPLERLGNLSHVKYHTITNTVLLKEIINESYHVQTHQKIVFLFLHVHYLLDWAFPVLEKEGLCCIISNEGYL